MKIAAGGDVAANIRAFSSPSVIPAEAGIQSFQRLLDPRFRGGDVFYRR